MANPTFSGMLGGFGLQGEEDARRAEWERNNSNARSLAMMTPQQQVAYAQIAGAQQKAQGIGGLLRGGISAATGADLSTAAEKKAQVRQQIQQALQGVDVSNPELVYPIIIKILQQNGMMAEAMQAAREFEEIMNKRRDDARATKKDEANVTFLKAKAAALKGNDFNEQVAAYQEIQEQLTNPELSQDSRLALQNMQRAYEVKLGIQRKADGTKYIPPSKYGKGGSFDPRTGTFTADDSSEANRPAAAGGGKSSDWKPIGFEYNEDETKKRKVLQNVLTQEKQYGPWEPVKNDSKANTAIDDAKGVIELLADAEKLYDIATGSGVGTIIDAAGNVIGVSSESADAAASLRAIGGALIAKMPKMTGPQSDKDVALYKDMAGRIGDSNIPPSQKRSAAKTIREINARYLNNKGVTPTGDGKAALGSKENPHRPTTRAEFDAIPKGQYWYKPSTKTTEIK